MTIGVVFIFQLPGTADWHVPQASPIRVVNKGGVISGGGVQPPKSRLDRVRPTGGGIQVRVPGHGVQGEVLEGFPVGPSWEGDVRIPQALLLCLSEVHVSPGGRERHLGQVAGDEQGFVVITHAGLDVILMHPDWPPVDSVVRAGGVNVIHFQADFQTGWDMGGGTHQRCPVGIP